jgi:hypothetical protein
MKRASKGHTQPNAVYNDHAITREGDSEARINVDHDAMSDDASFHFLAYTQRCGIVGIIAPFGLITAIHR